MKVNNAEIEKTLRGFWPSSVKYTPEFIAEYAAKLGDVSKADFVTAVHRYRDCKDNAERVPDPAKLKRYLPREDVNGKIKSSRIASMAVQIITNHGWDEFIRLVYRSDENDSVMGVNMRAAHAYFKKAAVYADEPYSGFPSYWQEFWRRLHNGDVYGAHVCAADQCPIELAGAYRKKAAFFKAAPFEAWRYFPVLCKPEPTGKVVNNVFLDKARELINKRQDKSA
ncbi:MAG: hypothetical protein GY869_14675 [Planctomycetes bacterium]|nr:hypothetical protein [Planctomycetota bacterium]